MYNRNYPYGLNGCAHGAVTLSGIVTNNGVAACGIVIDYTINGTHKTAVTGTSGAYSFTVPYGAKVTIHAIAPGVGTDVTPPVYVINRACASQSGYNFTLTAVVPDLITVMGRVQGLPQLCGVEIICCINGVKCTFLTDSYGYYRFTVPYGACLDVHPIEACGYTVSPSDLHYDHVYCALVLPTCTYVPACGA